MAGKPEVLLLPGLLCDEYIWTHQMAALKEYANFSVPLLSGGNRVEQMASAILEKAPRKFCLAGLSLGACVALEMALQAPERIERLCLMAWVRPINETEKKMLEISSTIARKGKFGLIARSYAVGASTPSADDYVEMAKRVGLENFIDQQTALIHREVDWDSYRKILCPTMVVAGVSDYLSPLQYQEQLANTIPRALLVEVDACGHLMTLEKPEDVSTIMLRWLAM